MQFEERYFQTQFSVFADKIYEWNIDGLSEQEIINKMGHMSMVGIAYINNHNLDLLGLVPLNPIVWCYVWYYVWHYVWHDVWLDIVINKVVLIIIWNNGNMNIWTLSYSPWNV